MLVLVLVVFFPFSLEEERTGSTEFTRAATERRLYSHQPDTARAVNRVVEGCDVCSHQRFQIETTEHSPTTPPPPPPLPHTTFPGDNLEIPVRCTNNIEDSSNPLLFPFRTPIFSHGV